MSKESEIMREHIRTHRTVLSMCNEPEDVILNRLLDDFDNKDQRIAELEEQLANSIRPKFKIGQEVFYIAPKRQIVKASVIGCFENGLIVQCKNRSFIKLLNENVFFCEEDAKIGIEKYYKSIHKNYKRNKLNNVLDKMQELEKEK